MDLRFPIGGFQPPEIIRPEHIEQATADLSRFPLLLKEEVQNLSTTQLNTPYREGGWTVRELIHHIADSHMHSYIRFKWALTEENPLIKAYNQDPWVKLRVSNTISVEEELEFIELLHRKLTQMIKALTADEFQRTYIHPEGNKTESLGLNVLKYAWHSMHHLAHIKALKVREQW